MEDLTRKSFFAASRGFYTDGITFIRIVGLSPNERESYMVTEQKLSKENIKLGDFLFARVTNSNQVEHFKKTYYLENVKVEGNYAKIIKSKVELILYNNGERGFRTSSFGIVRASDQLLDLGCYNIDIVAPHVSSFSTSPLIANVTSTAASLMNSSPDLFSKLSSIQNVNSHVSSSFSLSGLKTTGESIGSLPQVAPIPLPRTVTPFGKPSALEGVESRPPTPRVVGGGFDVKEPLKKTMTAFVVHVHKKPNVSVYFFWVCDVKEEAVLHTSPKLFQLQLGHFFRGEFIEQKNQKSKWKCVKYLEETKPLIKGNLVRGRVELTVKVVHCHAAVSPHDFRRAYAEHVGSIIDKDNKLPANCVGRLITVERTLVKQNFEWIVTGLE